MSLQNGVMTSLFRQFNGVGQVLEGDHEVWVYPGQLDGKGANAAAYIADSCSGW
jgi:hypothetical protein